MNNSLLNRLDRKFIDHGDLGRKSVLKLIMGFVILVALLTHGRFDPSPSNLLMPTGSLNDWLGLPGALFSGFLLEFIGRMAYVVPFLIIFFSRSKPGFKPGHIIMEILELLSLCTLVPLILPLDPASRFHWAGSWGFVSTSVLLDFPGKGNTLAILTLFQFFYFREKKINLTVFKALRLVFLITVIISKKAQVGTRSTFQKTAKYARIKWFSPVVMLFSRTSDKTSKFAGENYLKLREKLSDANLLSRLITVPLSWFKKDSDWPFSAIDQSAQRRKVQNSILALVIAEYRKSYYKSDSKAFLKLEEEI